MNDAMDKHHLERAEEANQVKVVAVGGRQHTCTVLGSSSARQMPAGSRVSGLE